MMVAHRQDCLTQQGERKATLSAETCACVHACVRAYVRSCVCMCMYVCMSACAGACVGTFRAETYLH